MTPGELATGLAEGLEDARAELAAALVATPPPEGWTVREYAGAGAWSGPAALIGTGIPYLERAAAVTSGAWRVRFGVLLVSGLFDLEASARTLDVMSAYALAAVYGQAAWEGPAVGPARMLELSGGRYLSATMSTARLILVC